MTGASTEVTGTLDRVIYHDPESHWTVGRLIPDGTDEPISIVGTVYRPTEGQVLRLTGQWQRHPRYGEQLRLAEVELVIPTSLDGLERFLASTFVKGLGPHYARKVVDALGERTIEVLDEQPELLLKIKGIGQKRYRQIVESWQETRQIRQLMIFLNANGLGGGLAVRIFACYGAESIARIRENPYQLAFDVDGIGFKTADKLAQNLGLPPSSPVRLTAGLLYTLHIETLASGHVYLPREVALEAAARQLEVDDHAALRQLLEGLIADGQLVLDAAFDDAPIYLPTAWRAERELATRLRTQALAAPPAADDDDDDLPHVGGAVALTEQQLAALARALCNRLSVITGGPGVGKTTLVRRLVAIARMRGLEVGLATPTGRASRRLAEAAGHPAQTLHRLLAYNPGRHAFEHDERNPLAIDLLIVDEISMVDMYLMRDTLRALPEHAGLVLVGDADQLPSVGAGNVLADLIRSRLAPVTRLTQIFRQASEGQIVANAHRVNAGEAPTVVTAPDQLGDFYHVPLDDPERVAEMVLRLVTERIPERFGLDPLRDVQVITPMHKGAVGTRALNAALQAALNPDGMVLERFGERLRVGDKVMQIRNDHDKEVYNGDIGVVAGYDEAEAALTVRFDDRTRRYEPTEADDLQLAYCITVHKSQGSEYPAVVMPLVTQHFPMLQRNLLYTAITRGRRLVVIVGSPRALQLAVANDRIRARHTRLAERLVGEGL